MAHARPLPFSFDTDLRKVPSETVPQNVLWSHMLDCVPRATSQNHTHRQLISLYYFTWQPGFGSGGKCLSSGKNQKTHKELRKSGKFLSEVPAILFPEQPVLETNLHFGWAWKILMRIVSAEANRRAWAPIKQSGTWASLQKLNNCFVFFPWFKWLWRSLMVCFGSTLCWASF